MGRVVVLGSLNVDLVAEVERHPRPGETVLATGPLTRCAGGKGANQALAAASAGARVVMVGCLGDDADGRRYLERLQGRGVDTSALRLVPGVSTGQAWITVDADSENAIVVIPGANAQVGADDLAPLDDLSSGDVLLAQLEVPVPVVALAARRARARGARVVINAAPYAALPHDVAAVADPLVVNEHEALMLADSDAVPTSVLVTFGGEGCSWDGERFEGVEVPLEEVVDTTGAGDAFCGALAAALAGGADRAAAVAAASRAGAEAVRRQGAQADPLL
ncbi:PfkB family carbohydrate kinase [Knoellia sp. 3-2P3]|uniref:PfkB family carbohydrate kinase n=1 Tax=unclassified Knoellia TaxID=2618719 RepID=UPI0023DAE58B|nr:PfkB family carbohydrate kinase [Knoellia sp. 3-2P3]MDF2093806.1 PfkB family carbohydrate kinase [Knoellia sp. 3-2P3]